MVQPPPSPLLNLPDAASVEENSSVPKNALIMPVKRPEIKLPKHDEPQALPPSTTARGVGASRLRARAAQPRGTGCAADGARPPAEALTPSRCVPGRALRGAEGRRDALRRR